MNLEPRRNKYVGHRYVPKIFGEWKRENSYEGLSIVTFEGNSYTSKKHVPAGVDIKNEEYWVLTGNYNAQIEYYRKETEKVSKENVVQDGKISDTDKRVTDIENHIKKQTVFPSDMTGSTDFEKVQKAFDTAISLDKTVSFERLYDITGHTVMLNKPNDRKILFINGVGGGLVKNDTGYFFSVPSGYTGDVISNNMKYRSKVGAGSVVFNGDGQEGILRLMTHNDNYTNVDTVINAPKNYIQSFRMIGCTVTGGKGWTAEFKKSFDSSFIENTIEHRENGIRNTGSTGNPDNNTLRIENNVIEGLTGKGLLLGSSFGVIISGNYMELNEGGYFDLSLSETNFHNGLVLTSNTIQQSKSQIDSKVAGIIVGRLGQSVNASGNISTGALFDTVKVGNYARIINFGSYSYSNVIEVTPENNIVKNISRVYESDTFQKSGFTERYYMNKLNEFINPSETKKIVFDFSDLVKFNDKTIVSIDSIAGTGDGNIQVLSWNRKILSNQVEINVKNLSSSSQNINTYVSVTKINI